MFVYFLFQNIIVDFEGKDADDGDYHGIKQLLHQLFLNATINTGNLTDIIIGNLIKTI